MATVREYFDTDFNRCLRTFADWPVSDAAGNTLPPVLSRISFDTDANAKYWSFYLPEAVEPASCISSILDLPETSRCVLSATAGDDVTFDAGMVFDTALASSTSLVFTKLLHFYIDRPLSIELMGSLIQMGRDRGFVLRIRDREYAKRRSEFEKPLAFISHDSRDKESLVRGLAGRMLSLQCRVWYDEFSLKVGDSLRASIENGLKETRKVVVVISPHFISNKGWSKVEFDSVFTREIIEKCNVILPVWHNIRDVKDVYEYCPRLADRFSLSSDIGVEALAAKLVEAIKS